MTQQHAWISHENLPIPLELENIIITNRCESAKVRW